MPLPSNVGTGTVTGNFSQDDIPGVVMTTWKVTLTPSERQFSDVTATPASIAFLKPSYVGTLDVDGNLSMTVPATNDADLNPLDFTYLVTYTFPGLGLNPRSFFIEVPEGGTVNLPTVNPVQQSNGALIVEGIPTGGATGQVLAKASGTSYDTEWVDQTGGGGGAVTSVAGKTGAVTLVSTDVTNFAEAVDDRVAALLVAGANVTLTYNDTAGTLTISAVGGGGGAVDSVNGQTGVVTLDAADVGARPDTYDTAWGDIGSKPAVIAAGADQGTARSAIGAGTSNLAIGTTSTTAMAGNKTAADLGGVTGTGISAIVKLTQAEYDAIPTPDPATLYWIV